MSIGKKMSFWELISCPDTDRIEIPQIQRDYVQGRNTPRVKYSRERMLNEIRYAIANDKQLDLNFVYGQDRKSVFVPIDGQQRLTTLLSLHIFAFSRERKLDELQLLKRKFRYLTRTSTERFLERLIDHLTEYFEQDKQAIDEFIKDCSWFDSEWDKDPSVTSFIVVLKDINEYFSGVSDLSNKLMSADCPVSFMALTISDVGFVNDLYIKMNSRGKALTEFESFKSELFDYLENIKKYEFLSDFKKKSDNEWLSMIWDICSVPEKECDTVYMSFLHRIIVNRLVAEGNITKESRLIENKGFYNFAEYEQYLSDGIVINDVHSTFELCRWLIQNSLGNKVKQLIIESGRLSHADQVQVVVLTKYAITVPKSMWNIDSWNAWSRIANNLINNTEIDKIERFISAAKSVYSMNPRALDNTINYFADTSPEQIGYFRESQVCEESLKCRLIRLDSKWLEIFVNAEHDQYFKGELQFALSLSGIENAEPSKDQKTEQARFLESWKLIKLIFDGNQQSKLCIDESLFRRGLLAYGDYSIRANPSSYTFYFEGGKGYFNWRRMLRDSLPVFSKLFSDLKQHGVRSTKDVEDFLGKKIDCFNDKSDEFRYYMIKIPDAFMFIHENNRFRKPEESDQDSRIILYSGATLKAIYAEAFSFFVFAQLEGDCNEYHYGRSYLNSETSDAYIERINGRSVSIKYDYVRKCYCQRDEIILDANQTPINTVDKMLSEIRNGSI